MDARTQPQPDELLLAAEEGKALAVAFQNGEKGAYQAIHDRYSPRVHGVCRKMLGHKDDAQEATQETFLRVYQALPRFNGRYQMGAWITRIAMNVCLDALRVRGRPSGGVTPMEDAFLESLEEPGENDPQDIVVRRAEGRRVYRVLRRLSPMHRAAIVLRDFEGLSYAEVATSLGITDPQAKALIHRARKAFKGEWASPLAAFLPLGWLQRIRRVDRVAKDQVATVTASGHPVAEVASSSAQYAASCSAFIQQCGQVVSERIGPVITALAVGVGSTAVAQTPAPAPVRVVVVERTIERSSAYEPTPEQVKSKPVEVADPVTEDSPPVTPPAEEAEPQPAPSAPPKETPEEPDEESSDQPEPTGFTLGFDTGAPSPAEPCTCIRQTTMRSNSAGATETSGVAWVNQSLEGAASADGSPSFGLDLSHGTDGNHHQMSFFLFTPEGGYGYRAEGTVVETAKTEWGGWMLTIEGTYLLTARPGYSEEMPEGGSYMATVGVSWRQRTVMSTSITLTDG